MVNSATTSSVKIKTTNASSLLNKQPKSSLVNIVNPPGAVAGTKANTPQGLRPILYQLGTSSNSITITPKTTSTVMGGTTPQQMTHAQLLELQKTILASHSLAAKINNAARTVVTTAASNLQISGASVTVNTKIPVHTTTNRVKSAFMQRKVHQQPPSTNANQVHITPLLQQRNLQQQQTPSATNPLLSNTKQKLTSTALSKLQAGATKPPTLKSFAEQIKALTPKQREILIKQYTASGKLTLPQVQTALANTSNPIVLASILKNRQVVPTATTTAKLIAQQQKSQKKQTLAKVFYFTFILLYYFYPPILNPHLIEFSHMMIGLTTSFDL